MKTWPKSMLDILENKRLIAKAAVIAWIEMMHTGVPDEAAFLDLCRQLQAVSPQDITSAIAYARSLRMPSPCDIPMYSRAQIDEAEEAILKNED